MSTQNNPAKRLYRSRKDRMISGVCGGIAEYFSIDPVIVRIIAVLLLLPGGLPGFIPYVVLWILVPETPEGSSSADSPKNSRKPVNPIDIDTKPKV